MNMLRATKNHNRRTMNIYSLRSPFYVFFPPPEKPMCTSSKNATSSKIQKMCTRTRAVFDPVAKTSPFLNCIILKLRYQKLEKPLQGNGSLFLEPNIQPIELFDFFDQAFRKRTSSLIP